jgi:hypothetical protein
VPGPGAVCVFLLKCAGNDRLVFSILEPRLVPKENFGPIITSLTL